MTAIVSCRGVERTYRQGSTETPALYDIDVDIQEGDFATLAGPSGSGKTTLLNAIGGLERPSKGKIVVDGETTTELGKNALANLRLHKIGFVFQSFNLMPVLSAAENVEFTLALLGVPTRERRARACEVLGEVGLAGLERRRPSKLSGGQQQRVAVARALGPKPKIVLADEPTASLDSKSADSLISLMAELNEKRGVTFLIATHDPRVMERVKRNIVMKDGRIISDERRQAATRV